MARFELSLLEELGFGLDLDSCAVTGATSELTHVSPKSGRAVSRAAAEPYLDKLLPLPSFLVGEGVGSAADLRSAFALTGHFLDRHVWSVRQVEAPANRESLIALVAG
jgi:DNA repair protein RecO (recombination protein O)